jgi:chemotaxis-related protein WspB
MAASRISGSRPERREGSALLFLVFQVGSDGYALAANRIIEVLPLVELRKIRGAPREVAGSMNYRGTFVPVIDLCQLDLGRPASPRMGTRIILVGFAAKGRDMMLGLIAESATETLRCDPRAFTPFADGPRGLVQRLDPDVLLPAGLFDLLFDQPEAFAG